MKKIFFIYPIFLFGFIGEIFSSTGKICIDPDATVTILMTTYDGTFDEHTLMQSPTIVNNSVTVFEGDLNTVLSTADLSSTDTDSNFTALGYTVGNVTNGTLTINGSAWASGSNDTFIQQDIIDGNILYSHNDSNTTSDSFSFSVSDGTNTLDFQIFNISIENVLSVNNLNLNKFSIYMVNSSLRIVGVESGKAEIRLYNILGSPIFISSFQGNGINNFSLPNINTGVYIVHLTAEKGMLNRKIIIEQNN